MKVTLLVPVRDEVISLPEILPQIDPAWVDEILFIDGHSTDGTPEYLEKRGYKVIRQRSHGLGGAYWEALEVAQGEIIVAFSPDGNSLPSAIPRLIEKMREGYEMAIASRYCDGAKSEDDDMVTRFGNWLFTWLVNLPFGGQLTDSLVILRAFRRDLPFRLGLRTSNLPIFEYELSIYCTKYALPVAEIGADEPKRIGGERKMRPLYNGLCLLWAYFRALLAPLPPPPRPELQPGHPT